MADLDLMAAIAQRLYLPVIIRAHGDIGGEVLRSLLSFIRQLYQHVAPETLSGRVVIFKTIHRAARPVSVTTAITTESFEGLAQNVTGPCTLQVLENGRVLLWVGATHNPEELALEAVVYCYEDRAEKFYGRNEVAVVDKILPECASNFASPTFDDLRAALESYRTNMIRKSSCQIFDQVWFESDRIFFRTRPERKMRQSLTQFLKIRLRGDIEVRPEQVVDETHPVDIKVTWFLSNRLALIEIKWLGRSRNAAGVTTNYSAARARSGARQLADYMNGNASQAPGHVTRGYLVVIDGRRYGLKAKTSSVSVQSGMYYLNSEIPYNPEFHKTRVDFEEPFRMFAEPICR